MILSVPCYTKNVVFTESNYCTMLLEIKPQYHIYFLHFLFRCLACILGCSCLINFLSSSAMLVSKSRLLDIVSNILFLLCHFCINVLSLLTKELFWTEGLFLLFTAHSLQKFLLHLPFFCLPSEKERH